MRPTLATAIIITAAALTIAQPAHAGDNYAGIGVGALARTARAVDAHPAWRDGNLHKSRRLIPGCLAQWRVFPSGRGYAGVTCGWRTGVALRDPSGRWSA